MRLLKRILNRLRYRVRSIRTRSHLLRLSRTLEPLASAISDTLKNQNSREEKAWIDKIESKRLELNKSTTEITVEDYGAGSPDLNLTEKEMYKGRTVNRTIGEVSRIGSKPYIWSLLLFKLIRKFRPSCCLELGTCVGISSSYQAAALKLNQLGRLVTLEGAKTLASLAMKNFKDLGIDNVSVIIGRFQDNLVNVLKEQVSIDYAFIDGHHDEQATLRYFEQILPFLSKKSLLVFDDISWSNGMERAWKAIASDDRVNISVDLYTMGICIIDNDIKQKESFLI